MQISNVMPIAMPIIVLLLSFSLKLFIDRTTTVNDAITSSLELPVDIAFVSLSLIIGFTISPHGDPQLGLLWFCSYLIATIFIVVFWKKSINSYITNGKFFIFGSLNYVISITGLVLSIKLLLG